MEVTHVADAGNWRDALENLSNPHVLQSWEWGQFKARHGWDTLRLVWRDGGAAVAAASVLQRKMPALPFPILYVSKGPILDWTDAGLVERVLADLESLARRRRALCIKIDPDVYYPDHAPSFSWRPACAPAIARLLQGRSWRYSDEQIQFCNTVLLDLTPSEEELLATMKQKSRYNVRLAGRRGVVVYPGQAADLETLYAIYAETAQRDGFVIRPPDYYLDVWRSFLDQGLAHLLMASFKGETVAGLILFTFGSTAWYMYGASSNRHRKHMPNYLLQWEAIRQAKDEGCLVYDLWGAPEILDESDPMWGVVRFKLSLGGELARGLGAWDFPSNRIGYRLYTTILPRYLDWLRKRNRGYGKPDGGSRTEGQAPGN